MTHPNTLPAHQPVTGAAGLILRAEGAVALAAAGLAFDQLDGPWTLFAALFLLPDLAMLGYLAGPRVGAVCYNLAHTTVLPLMLALAGWALGLPGAVQVALIWNAHIGFDRALGYGLKYPVAFKATHLG
jgi:hypothetical protein